jgi:hypothetical protein
MRGRFEKRTRAEHRTSRNRRMQGVVVGARHFYGWNHTMSSSQLRQGTCVQEKAVRGKPRTANLTRPRDRGELKDRRRDTGPAVRATYFIPWRRPGNICELRKVFGGASRLPKHQKVFRSHRAPSAARSQLLSSRSPSSSPRFLRAAMPNLGATVIRGCHWQCKESTDVGLFPIKEIQQIH